MSFLAFRKMQRAVLIPLVVALAIQASVRADDCCPAPACHQTCCRWHCPPCFKWCIEGPPKIKFKCGCPKPVCVPDCSTPNWGYFGTCWRPWPWPADCSHCPCPTPAAVAGLCGPACTVPGMTNIPVGEPIPPPQPMGAGSRQGL